jgi:hypothetical protein
LTQLVVEGAHRGVGVRRGKLTHLDAQVELRTLIVAVLLLAPNLPEPRLDVVSLSLDRPAIGRQLLLDALQASPIVVVNSLEDMRRRGFAAPLERRDPSLIFSALLE